MAGPLGALLGSDKIHELLESKFGKHLAAATEATQELRAAVLANNARLDKAVLTTDKLVVAVEELTQELKRQRANKG